MGLLDVTKAEYYLFWKTFINAVRRQRLASVTVDK